MQQHMAGSTPHMHFRQSPTYWSLGFMHGLFTGTTSMRHCGATIRKHLQVKGGSKAGLLYLQLWDVYKLEGHEVL